MDCRQSRSLMAAALDQANEAASVPGHVHECASCSDEWMRLQAVERLLDQARFEEVPDLFVATTMERIVHSGSRLDAVPNLRWSEAGVIVLGSIAASMLIAFWLRSPAGPHIDLHFVAGVVNLVGGLATAIVRAPAALVSIQLCLALAVAALWFVAVVAPRTSAFRRIV